MTCQEAVPLLPLHAEGALDPEEAAGLAAHLSACPRCRQEEGVVRALAGRIRSLPLLPAPAWRQPKPALPAWLRAAAALLLLALGAWAVPWRKPARPAGGAPPPSPPDARPEPPPAGVPLRLDAGPLWLRAESPLEVLTPLGTLRLERGEGALRASAAAPAAMGWNLLREADAAEVSGALDLILLEGSEARLLPAGARPSGPWAGPCRVRLAGGREASVAALGEGDVAEAFAWKDEAEGAGPWKDLGAPPASGALLEPLPAGTGELVIEAELLAPAGSQVAFCYPAGAGTGCTVLGGGALAPGAWQRFRLQVSPGRLDLYASGRRIVSCVPQALAEMGPAPGVGLKVWQGPVAFRRLRWRPAGGRP